MNRPGDSAIVIGAAGGIGQAVAAALCNRRIPVLGVDLLPRVPRLESYSCYEHLQLDFTTVDAVAALMESRKGINARYIINVAGGALPEEIAAPELTIAWQAFDLTMSINIRTCLAAITCAVELAKWQSLPASISLTLCSSINAVGSYQYPLYSASKGAVESLVHSLCVPLGKNGIRINCVRLGTILTEASKGLHGEANDEHYGPLRRSAALGRFVSIDEAADALLTTAVDLSGVTGTVLTVDAGQSIPGNPRAIESST